MSHTNRATSKYDGYQECPHCGVVNTPWRRYCKECRQSLDDAVRLGQEQSPKSAVPASSAPPSSAPYTGETLTIYYSLDKYQALVMAQSHLEYQGYGYRLITTWNNVLGFSTNQAKPSLVLQKPAEVFGVNGPLNLEELNIETRRIPLMWFDYPNNSALVRDLQRHMASWPS